MASTVMSGGGGIHLGNQYFVIYFDSQKEPYLLFVLLLVVTADVVCIVLLMPEV